MQAKALSIAAISPAEINRSLYISFLTVTAYMLLCYAVIACTFPSGALNTPMGAVLCDVVLFIYGNLGRSLATLAVIILGVGALLGKTSWGIAITVSVGISVIFNAELVASLLICGDTSADIC